MSTRKIVRQLNDMERRIFAPHIEALRTYQALVRGFDKAGTQPGVSFDPDAGCYYVDVPDAEPTP